MRRASSAHRPASARNGTGGSPGTMANAPSTPAAVISARGLRVNCVTSDGAMPPLVEPCVTRMPAAVLTISAGICVTSPSPMVSML